MNPKKWCLRRPAAGVVDLLAAGLPGSAILAAVLANRGVETIEEARAFLDPALERLHDPSLMSGMGEAVDAVEAALRDDRQILVWGDYDVDGVTSTVLLYDYLRRHRSRPDQVGYYIPHRTDEGYSLNEAALRRHAGHPLITAGKRGLIVTVDCGVSNATEVDLADLLSFDVVVTDHHTPPDALPAAKAVLNPRREGCGYPFKDLAGVGIAFKLVQALAQRLGPGTARDPFDLYACLDLVALGTVADIAPLLGENRVLVHHGLARLGSSPRPGVQALLEIAKIERRPVRASQISFGLGPRINAAGRLGHADAAVELLLSANLQQARERAAELEGLNDERRRIESRIREEAIRMVETSPGMLDDAVLVLADPGWHPGVIGIVAAKVAERFGRPALLVATGTEPAKGSARSVPEIDLYARLARCGGLFTSLGGHAQAAGFSIRRADLPRLRREINRDASGSAHPAPAPRRIDVDALVRFKDLDASLSDELRRLAPFGQHNPEPAFATSGVLLAQPPRSVGNNHLRLSLVEKTREPARTALHRKSFIGFNLGGAAGELADGMRVDVVYDLDLEGGANGSWERYRLRDVAASEAP